MTDYRILKSRADCVGISDEELEQLCLVAGKEAEELRERLKLVMDHLIVIADEQWHRYPGNVPSDSS